MPIQFYGSVDGVKANLPKIAKYIKTTAVDLLDIAETTVQGVLAEYSRRVDAALGSRYVVPFADPSPALIGSIVTDLASVKISQQFQTQITAEENQNLLAIRKDAKELLASIAKGDAQIPGIQPITGPDELASLFAGSEDESIFNMEDPSTWQAKA